MEKSIIDVISSKNAHEVADEKKRLDRNYYVTIDWLQFTVKNRQLDDVLTLLKLDDHQPILTDSGLFGYNKTLTFFEKVKVMYRVDYVKGDFVVNEDMGYHILLSGRACREYEKNVIGLVGLLYRLFSTFVNYDKENNIYRWNNLNITRIDYAIDYFTPSLVNIKKLKSYVKSGQCTSRFRKAVNTESIDLSDGKTLGDTLYFGSISSNVRIVFYDKLIERNDAGYIVADYINFWERCEIRLKQDKANESVIWLMLNNGKIGELLGGILRRYIQFRKKGKTKERNKWPIHDWWLSFTLDCDPLELSSLSIQSTLQQKKEYVQTHWTSLLTEIAAAEIENLDKTLKQYISNPRIDSETLARINNYRISKGYSILSMDQFLQIVEVLQNIKIDYKNPLKRK